MADIKPQNSFGTAVVEYKGLDTVNPSSPNIVPESDLSSNAIEITSSYNAPETKDTPYQQTQNFDPNTPPLNASDTHIDNGLCQGLFFTTDFVGYFYRIKYMSILKEIINVEGLEDKPYTKFEVLDKWLQGNLAFTKFGNIVYPVNISVGETNFLGLPAEITIQEPKSERLNKTFKQNEDFIIEGIQEVRYSQERLNFISFFRPYEKMISQIWHGFIKENKLIFDKYLVNANILNMTEKNKEDINKAVQSDNTIELMNMVLGGKNTMATDDQYIKFEWNKEVTERLIKKWEHNEKEISKMLGLPFNNQADKKGANLISGEIEIDNIVSKAKLNFALSLANADLQRSGFSKSIEFVLNKEYETKEKEVENEQLPNTNNGN